MSVLSGQEGTTEITHYQLREVVNKESLFVAEQAANKL